MSKKTEYTREDHKAMMQDQSRWPRWFFLPVKRWVGHDLQCGVLHRQHPGPVRPQVVRANIFNLPQTREEFLALPKHDYGSFDSLLDDGWEVD